MKKRVSGGLLRRHRDFRLLWCGEVASKFGASVTGVAMPLVAGLGSGGLTAQLAGAVNSMFANAGTFLISLLCLSGIRHREPPVNRPSSDQTSLLGEVRGGLRLVAKDPWLRTLTLFGAASNVGLMGYQSIQVVFLVERVGLAPGAVGGLVAAGSAGGIVGAFTARRVAERIDTARTTLLFELGLGALALLIPLTMGGVGLLLYIAGGFCVSAGVVGGNVIKASFQQRYCPPELLGRVTASSAFLNYGAIPLGALLGGTLGTVLGLRGGMWIMTGLVPLSGLILLFSAIRRCRDLPTDRRPLPGAAVALPRLSSVGE